MTTPKANGLPVISADIRMPVIGAWRIKLEVSSATVLKGPVTLTSDGISFTGTAMPNRSGPSGSRSRAMVVGGAGGLSTVLPAKNYANGVSVRTVVGDILRECGESLSSASDEGLLGSVLPKWERVRAAASRSLVGILDQVGGIWRLDRAGAVLVTVEAYPVTNVEHELLDEDWAAGRTLIRPKAPDLLPGVTFLGQQIRFVRHRIDSGGMRTETYLRSPGGLLEQSLSGIRRKLDYSQMWPARVVKQNSDETLEVVPDDERLRQGRGGINRVPIRHGIPGVRSILVSAGARIRISFDGGDPDKPFAALWDSGSADLVQLGPLGAGVAYEGSAVEVYLPPAMPVSGTLNGAPFVGVITVATPAVGVVQIGSQTVKV